MSPLPYFSSQIFDIFKNWVIITLFFQSNFRHFQKLRARTTRGPPPRVKAAAFEQKIAIIDDFQLPPTGPPKSRSSLHYFPISVIITLFSSLI